MATETRRPPSAVYLPGLPPPVLVERLDFEAIVAAMKADFETRWAAARAADPSLVPFDATLLASDPVVVLLEVVAYRELLMRARVNDAARGLLVAFAVGADLEQLGAAFGVARMPGEDDERLRRRIGLAPEAFSSAGPAGAYVFHALSADPSVADAAAARIGPGKVRVAIAGAPGADLEDAARARVAARLARDDVVPLTDDVAVVVARPVRYAVQATLAIPPGPDPGAVRAEAEAALRSYAAGRNRIGTAHHRSGVIAALKVGGVEDVALVAPPADILAAGDQIARLGEVSLRTRVLE